MGVAAARQHGATLIELVATIAVLSVAVAGLILAVASVTGRSADPMLQVQASAIAQAHLEEVLLKSFCDPDYDADGDPATPLDCPSDCTAPVCGACRGFGAGTEASRDLYDDICDYDGLATAGAFDQTGAPIAGLGAYAVRIDVVDAGATLDALDGGAGQTARIDVTVSHPAMERPVQLSAYRANF